MTCHSIRTTPPFDDLRRFAPMRGHSSVGALLAVIALAPLASRAAVATSAAPPGAVVLDGPRAAQIDGVLTHYSQRGLFAGVVFLVRHGKPILIKGYGLADRARKIPFDRAVVFDVGSITKQFTATAILRLESEGKLSVQDPLKKYFPDLPADKIGITLHHLLTHTAGFKEGFGGDYEHVSAVELRKRMWAAPLRFPPGERYFYSNAGYSLLGMIVEQVSGQGYEHYLHDNLFRPAGMEHTGYLIPDWSKQVLARQYDGMIDAGVPTEQDWAPDGPYWNLRANGGILSTVDDLYRWHLALLGDNVLPTAAKIKLFKPYIREGFYGDRYYGYGWRLATTAHGKPYIFHLGGGGISDDDDFETRFMRFLADDDVFISYTNDFQPGYVEFIEDRAMELNAP
jgi:CubicO group peptidase (beta-lactamase class C family)